MDSNIHQQLLRPPFFAIPGVDPASPLPTQMEQIDQLNTLCLQEIDANFARFHQVVTTRILPSIKKYAIASEPTRDAATFWNNFYLKAYGPSPLDADAEDATQEHDRTTYEDQTMPMDSMTQSFAFEPKAGFSSTPMPKRTQGPQTSLEESIESPFDRTERQLGALALDETELEDAPTPSLPTGYGFGHLSNDSSAVSPPSVVRRTDPTPRRAGTPERDYNHRLIDMTATPLNAKFHPLQPTSAAANARSRKIEGGILDTDEAEDDDLTLSPFKTMTFNKLPKANALLQAGSTPIKRQGLQDILAEMEEFDSPRVDTPKEFRRYSVMPGMGEPARRLFDDSPGPSGPRRSLANTSYGSDIQVQDATGVVDNSDSDGDNTFSDDDTAAMQAHADAAGAGFELVDDSYVSEASFERREASELFGPGGDGGQFALHKQDEMVTYHGGRLEDAQGPESPTAKR